MKMETCLLQTQLTVVRGPLLDEVHQQPNSWISQVIHLLKNTFDAPPSVIGTFFLI